MKTILITAIVSILLGLAKPSVAINYAWLTNIETSGSFPGHIIRFTGHDTLWGPVHSNDWIATQNVQGLPVFYGQVSTTMPRFRPGSPDPPAEFLGGPPVFNAPPVLLPETLDHIRDAAMNDNTFMSIDGKEWYASICGDSLVCYYWPEGTMLDTTYHSSITLDIESTPYVFFNGKVDVRGVMDPNGLMLVIASERDMRLLDNVMLAGTDTTSGELPAGATSAICLTSERSILIGNTWENGRENRTLGSSVVITALIFAIRGSFQLEQMNDANDPYISPTTPDERGDVIVNGGITQWQRGYFHRSNRGGTGYSARLLYDARLREWNPGINGPIQHNPNRDSLLFDDTPVGTAALDTFHLNGFGPFSGALATYPFYSNAPYDPNGQVDIPVRFTPPSVGIFSGNLTFFVGGAFRNVVLYGRGIPPSGSSVVNADVFPNPFNSSTTIRFTLPNASEVSARVFDVLGREVVTLATQAYPAGNHSLTFDGSGLSSGVYFLAFQAGDNVSTHKLLLLK